MITNEPATVGEFVACLGMAMGLVVMLVAWARRTSRRWNQAAESAVNQYKEFLEAERVRGLGVSMQDAAEGFRRLAGHSTLPADDCEGCGARMARGSHVCTYCKRER